MRRDLLLAAALLIVVPAASLGCARGDDDEGGEDTSEQTTTTQPDTSPSGPTTLPLPETSATECEDVPAPADYPDDRRPRAFRPCTLPTQLAAHSIRTGTGRPAQAGDTLYVDYTGIRSADGSMFDSSYLRGIPLDFELGRGNVIAGWEQALVGATAGSLLKLDVPPDLAYGDSPPSGAIQPGDALTFVIEVRAVVPPLGPDDAPLDVPVSASEGAEELRINDVVVGDGAVVEAGHTAIVHMLLVRGDNLVVMLDSWKRREPLHLIVDVNEPGDFVPVAGLVTGLEGARVGGRRVLTIPPDLAFGADGESGLGLPPDTDLIVVVDILGTY